MKLFLMISVMTLLFIGSALANEDFGQAKKLVDSKVSCLELSEEQLEAVGDYYMEQIHPGEVHELMDQMHGGEGSAQLKQMHILMAKRLYCKEYSSTNNFGMMSSGMMNMMGGGNVIGYGGMMGYGSSGWGWWSIFSIVNYLLIVALIIAAIYWLIKNADKKR